MLTRSSLPLLVLLSALLADTARAQAPVYFWGLQRGSCEALPEVDRLVEKRLHSSAQSVTLLRTPAGQPLPLCQGPRCAELVRGSCPGAGGRVLGGQVVQGKNVTNFRLWLYDLGTGQIAYQDDFCQSCSLTDAVIVQAKALIEKPRFEAVPGPHPSYCSRPAGGGESQAAGGASGPIFLVVHGQGAHKTAVHAALRAQLEALGRPPLPVTIDSKTYTLDILQKIVEGQQNARVLGAEVKAAGRVELFLFDQKTGLTDDESVRCPDCTGDSLSVQVKQAVSALLDHCFGAQCASNGTAQPPAEACIPFPEQQCPGLDALLGPKAAVGLDQDRLTPKTARLIKGLTWGAFAASAATSIALFAANGSVNESRLNADYQGTLTRAAWTSAAFAVLTLAVAVPTTVVVNRASRTAPAASGAGSSAALVQCPN